MTKTDPAHQLICDGEVLCTGVRRERPWHCACGVKFFGYDATVRRAHRAHLARASA